jgi:V/A-type H+-transporting ATPase subunit C
MTYLFMLPVGIILLIVAARIAALVKQIAPFSYPNARIMAKTGKLLSDGTFEELSEATGLEDIVTLLKETEYADYLSEYVGETYNLLDIEWAFNNHLADVYNQVYAISPPSVKPIFEVLLKRWDIENIIRTMRCLYAGKDPKRYLIGTGTFTDAQREQLAKSQSVEEVTMSITAEFEHILNNVQDQELVVIENTLIKYYYESLWHFLEHSRDVNVLLLKDYYGMQIDTTNVLAALRLNVMEEHENVSANFLPVTYHVSHEDLKSIVSAEDITIALTVLSNTPYAPIFEQHMAALEKDKDLSMVERALNTMIIGKGREVATLNPLGIGPSIGYLAQKQNEVRRLKTVVIGAFEGISPDKIKRYVGVAS